MLATRQLVSQIRQLLQTEEEVDLKRLGELIPAYAEACRRVNEKAGRCLQMLREGQRGEARRLAKELPDLQQEILLLDFEERPTWLDLCERAGTPVSEAFDPQAMLSIAQELYAETGALDHLLRMHRRMALGGAPIADRLRVLRQIRDADPAREYWVEDIRTYEQETVRDLLAQAEQADRAGDLMALQSILRELRSPEWTVRPPPATIRAVEKVTRPHLRRFALDAYGKIGDSLREAYSAQDGPRCRELLAQWDRVGEATSVEPPPESAEETALVREWLDARERQQTEDEAYKKACLALEQGVYETKDLRDLDRMEAEALRFDRGLPARLATMVENRRDQLVQRKKRKHALLMTGIIGGVLLLGGVVAWYLVTAPPEEEFRQFLAQSSETLEHVRAGLQSRQVEEAEVVRLGAVLSSARPEWRDRPELKTLQQEINQLVGSFEEIQRAFKGELDAVTGRLADLQGTVEDIIAGEAPLTQIVRDAGSADSRLEGAKQQLDQLLPKALTAEQKTQVRAQAQRLAATRDLLNQSLGKRVGEAAEDLRAQAGAFHQEVQRQTTSWAEKMLETSSEDVTALVAPLRERGAAILDALRYMSRVPNAPESLVATLKLTGDGVQSDRADLDRALDDVRTFHAMLERVAESYNQPDALEAALTAFAQRFPAIPLAQEFTEAAKAAPAWRDAAAWETCVRQWGPRVVPLSDQKVITERVQENEQYLTSHPDSPHRPQAEDYLAYLHSAQNALTDGKLNGLSGTMSLLNLPVIANLYVVEATGRKIYYVRNPQDAREQRADGRIVAWNIRYVVDGAMNIRTILLRGPEWVAGPRLAPQSEWAQAVMNRILANQPYRWETLYLELARDALQREDMDPILLATILKRDLLPNAIASTPFVADKIKQLAVPLESMEMIDLAWMNPEEEEANNTRPLVARLLRSIGNLDTLIQEVNARVESLGKSLVAYRPAGILLPGNSGIRLDPGLDGAPVYALTAVSGTRARYRQVGIARKGQLEPQGGGVGRLPKGSPLFVPVP